MTTIRTTAEAKIEVAKGQDVYFDMPLPNDPFWSIKVGKKEAMKTLNRMNDADPIAIRIIRTDAGRASVFLGVLDKE